MPTRSGGASVNESVREIPKAPVEPINYQDFEGPHKNSVTNSYEYGKQEAEAKDTPTTNAIEGFLARPLTSEEKTTSDRLWKSVMANIDSGVLGNFDGINTAHGQVFGPRIGYDVINNYRDAVIYAISNDENGNVARKVDLFTIPNTQTGDNANLVRIDVKQQSVRTPDVVVELVNRQLLDAKEFIPRDGTYRKISPEQTPNQIDKAERARQLALLHRQQRAGGDEAELTDIAKERNASILRQRTARG